MTQKKDRKNMGHRVSSLSIEPTDEDDDNGCRNLTSELFATEPVIAIGMECMPCQSARACDGLSWKEGAQRSSVIEVQLEGGRQGKNEEVGFSR